MVLFELLPAKSYLPGIMSLFWVADDTHSIVMRRLVTILHHGNPQRGVNISANVVADHDKAGCCAPDETGTRESPGISKSHELEDDTNVIAPDIDLLSPLLRCIYGYTFYQCAS